MGRPRKSLWPFSHGLDGSDLTCWHVFCLFRCCHNTIESSTELQHTWIQTVASFSSILAMLFCPSAKSSSVSNFGFWMQEKRRRDCRVRIASWLPLVCLIDALWIFLYACPISPLQACCFLENVAFSLTWLLSSSRAFVFLHFCRPFVLQACRLIQRHRMSRTFVVSSS